MAIKFCYSGATGTADGSSWTNAYTSITTATSALSAGDDLYIASDHVETAGTSTWTIASSPFTPTRLISVNRTSGAVERGAKFDTNTASSSLGITVATSGAPIYLYGLIINIGTGQSTTCSFFPPSNGIYYIDCSINLKSTGVSSKISYSGNRPIVHINTDFSFGSAGNIIELQSVYSTFRNCTVLGSNGPNNLLSVVTNRRCRIEMNNCDLSLIASSSKTIAATGANSNMRGWFHNCKLGAGTLICGNVSHGEIWGDTDIYVVNTDSSGINIRNEKHHNSGFVLTSNTIYKTSGSTIDGTTSYSHQMTSELRTTIAEPLESFEMVVWNDNVGATVTAALDMAIPNGTTLTTADVYMDVYYMGTSGSTLLSKITVGNSNPTAAGTNYSANSPAVWTGLTTPSAVLLTTSFTPQVKGYVKAIVRLTKANTTIYVDPTLTLS